MQSLFNQSTASDHEHPQPNSLAIRRILIISLFSSILITIIHNLPFEDQYLRDFILPWILLVLTHLYLIRTYPFNINKKAYLLLIPITVILSSEFIVSVDISNQLLNIFVLPLLISIFYYKLVNPAYQLTKETFWWIFRLFPSHLFRNLVLIKAIPQSNRNSRFKTIFSILIGLLIGLPIAFVVLSLLSSADTYFDAFIGFLIDDLHSILFYQFDVPGNLCFAIIFSLMTYTIFINLIRHQATQPQTRDYHGVNATISLTILSIINAIYAIFAISEVSKLTTNFLKLPVLYTYALYAREGFFQLLAVTIINFGIIIYHCYYSDKIKTNKLIRNSLLILIIFSVLLVFNSFYRMGLYLDAYGLTILRLQVILFLVMELLLFLILIKKLYFTLHFAEGDIVLTILTLFYILNLYLASDQIISCLNQFLNY